MEQPTLLPSGPLNPCVFHNQGTLRVPPSGTLRVVPEGGTRGYDRETRYRQPDAKNELKANPYHRAPLCARRVRSKADAALCKSLWRSGGILQRVVDPRDFSLFFTKATNQIRGGGGDPPTLPAAGGRRDEEYVKTRIVA
eukprot:gene25253-biopygen15014